MCVSMNEEHIWNTRISVQMGRRSKYRLLRTRARNLIFKISCFRAGNKQHTCDRELESTDRSLASPYNTHVEFRAERPTAADFTTTNNIFLLF